MIQKLFIRTIFILIASFTLYACTNQGTKDEQKQTDQKVSDSTNHDLKQTATYQCPMKCEGDKTYAEAGICPECEMDLAKVE